MNNLIKEVDQILKMVIERKYISIVPNILSNPVNIIFIAILINDA